MHWGQGRTKSRGLLPQRHRLQPLQRLDITAQRVPEATAILSAGCRF
ncbi:hypothetical protein [Bacteroides fluxus]|nr:hypothetical protein [Bacteroides fluxus]